MNKILDVETKEKNDNLDDETQMILEEATSLILSSNEQKKKKNKIILYCSIILFILIFLLLFSTVFALININNKNILNNICINGIDVSNLSIEDAKKKLSLTIKERMEKQILVKYLDFEGVFFPEQIGLSFDIDKSIDTAYLYGRSDNLFKNNFDILSLKFKNNDIPIDINCDEKLLLSVINETNKLLPNKLTNPDYYINNDNNLIISSGKDGVIINNLKFKDELLNLLKDFNNPSPSMDIPTINQKTNKINIDEIYKNVYKPPIDATYSTNPYMVTPSVNGIDFNISINEAKKMIENYQEEYSIPLKILYPNFTTNQIGQEAFPNLLSKFSTSFSSSNYNRSTNITLCAEKINGFVLMPGETFSFNQVVGKRTAAAGFKPAPAYLNGKVIQDYGGGICQVSSTLYNAVLYSNLEIVERVNHGYKPSYVKPGLDATVSWGGPDFKFKNNRNYPIKIVIDSSRKNLKIYIYGLKTDNDYQVKLESKYIRSLPYKTVYEKDSSLAPNEQKVLKNGSDGCKTATYKYLYDANGTFISSECISRDTYNPHNKIVAVGN